MRPNAFTLARGQDGPAYWLKVNAMAEPMHVKEDAAAYGEKEP